MSKEGTYQLVKVPSANGHVTLVVIHALAEVADVSFAGGSLPGAVRCAALPETVVHRLGLCRRGLLGLGRSAGAAAGEKTTYGVADGGTDCYTTVRS